MSQTRMWRQVYEAALQEHNATPGSAICATEKLLDAALKEDSCSGVDGSTQKTRLALIGAQLRMSMDELNTRYGALPRHEKLGGIQLQAIARLLCCCDAAALNAIEPSKKKKKSGKTKKNKHADIRDELRALLDRTALLMDSGSPPSITESDAEPAPFHHFLVNVLEAKLGSVLPDVFRVLRTDYELGDDDDDSATVRPLVQLKAKQPKNPDPRPTDASSILSALKDERPTGKHPRSTTQDPFKQVVLPSKSLLQRAPVSRPRRLEFEKAPTSSSQSSGKTSKRPHADSAPKSLVSLAAESKKARRSGSALPKTGPPSMPLLVRNVDRTLLPSRSSLSTAAPRPQFAVAPGRPITKDKPSSRPSSVTAGSTVMRTPDRPHRVKHTQPRILVVSSPPLRRPAASARSRTLALKLPQ